MWQTANGGGSVWPVCDVDVKSAQQNWIKEFFTGV
jgi:hypothetical protein